MQVGYRRVSTELQNTARQLEGVTLDKVFEDKLSGKDRHRPELQAALAFCREGDTLVVHSMDRLARNLMDLQQIVEELNCKGVAVQFIKEQLTFQPGKTDKFATLQLQLMGAFAEFERAMIAERRDEGIAYAVSKGKYKGRKKSLSPEKALELRCKASQPGANKSELAAQYKISRETLYSYLRQ